MVNVQKPQKIGGKVIDQSDSPSDSEALVFSSSSDKWEAQAQGGGSNAEGAYGLFLVAANNARADTKTRANFLCDGTDDEVQINLAIDDATTQGGIVQLSEGTLAREAR